MEYREYKPCARLRPFIRCYWTLRGEVDISIPPHRVFPDGSMELIFHVGEPFFRLCGSGAFEPQSCALIAGQIWTPVDLKASLRADVVGVRFQPAGAWPFFRIPMSELSGRIEPLEHLWGRQAACWRDRVGNARDRVTALENALLEHLPSELPDIPVLSERQRRRKYLERVGVTPKLFARIQRFQQALRTIGAIPLARVAADCGYSDQSHLVRDFRQFAGMAPSQWLQSREDVRFFQDALDVENLD